MENKRMEEKRKTAKLSDAEFSKKLHRKEVIEESKRTASLHEQDKKGRELAEKLHEKEQMDAVNEKKPEGGRDDAYAQKLQEQAVKKESKRLAGLHEQEIKDRELAEEMDVQEQIKALTAGAAKTTKSTKEAGPSNPKNRKK